MISISRDELLRIQAIIGAHLGAEATEALAKSSKSSKPAKAEKKPRANAGVGTAWSAYCKKLMLDHAEEVELVKQEAKAASAAAKEAGEAAPKQGAHLAWCSRYRDANQAEWIEFEAEWKLSHPKGSAASSVADDSSVAGSAVASEGGAAPAKKARKTQSAEVKAAAAIKRAATKAAKAGIAPPDAPPADTQDEVVEEEAVDLSQATVEAEEAEEVDDELLPFTIGKTSYQRWGHLDAEEQPVWHPSGWTWRVNADGSRGAFAGKVDAKGKLDSSPSAMADPPEFE
jgi:hypothetical protein